MGGIDVSETFLVKKTSANKGGGGGIPNMMFGIHCMCIEVSNLGILNFVEALNLGHPMESFSKSF